MMRIEGLLLAGVTALVVGCGKAPQVAAAADTAPSEAGDATGKAEETDAAATGGLSAGDIEFPVIPQIRVPSLVGSSKAQQALEESMKSLLDPIAGITVRPANCATDGALINESGFTNVDADGNLQRVSADGVFDVGTDGSGLAVGRHGVVEVDKDGGGRVVNEQGVFEVRADGSGSFIGDSGAIELDGRGGGSWSGTFGVIENHGDGSGSWSGSQGTIEINADGSGKWIGGPHAIVENRGDGTGTIGAPPREVKMAPIPPLAPAGRFPPLTKFKTPGAPCGYVITLNDAVLFDFDKSDIRPDAARVLDTLAGALKKAHAQQMEVRGHTDAKGSDDYNQALSQRRADAVVGALRQRGVADDANARGFGESQPVAPNEINGKDNPAGRQLNRRVEIFVRS